MLKGVGGGENIRNTQYIPLSEYYLTLERSWMLFYVPRRRSENVYTLHGFTGKKTSLEVHKNGYRRARIKKEVSKISG